jgi:hypothetical protein
MTDTEVTTLSGAKRCTTYGAVSEESESQSGESNPQAHEYAGWWPGAGLLTYVLEASGVHKGVGFLLSFASPFSASSADDLTADAASCSAPPSAEPEDANGPRSGSSGDYVPFVTRSVLVNGNYFFHLEAAGRELGPRSLEEFMELHDNLQHADQEAIAILPFFPTKLARPWWKLMGAKWRAEWRREFLNIWLKAAWEVSQRGAWRETLKRFAKPSGGSGSRDLAEEALWTGRLYNHGIVPVSKWEYRIQPGMRNGLIPVAKGHQVTQSSIVFCMCKCRRFGFVPLLRRHLICAQLHHDEGLLLLPLLYRWGEVDKEDLVLLDAWFLKWAVTDSAQYAVLPVEERQEMVEQFASSVLTWDATSCRGPQRLLAFVILYIGAVLPRFLALCVGLLVGWCWKVLMHSVSDAVSPAAMAFALVAIEGWVPSGVKVQFYLSWGHVVCLMTLSDVCYGRETEVAIALTCFCGFFFAALHMMGLERAPNLELLNQSDGSMISLGIAGLVQVLPAETSSALLPYLNWAKGVSVWKDLLLLLPAAWFLFPVALVASELKNKQMQIQSVRQVVTFIMGPRMSLLAALIVGFLLNSLPSDPLEVVEVLRDPGACIGRVLFLGHFLLRRRKCAYWASFLLLVLHAVAVLLTLGLWLQARGTADAEPEGSLSLPALWSVVLVQGVGALVSARILVSGQGLSVL